MIEEIIELIKAVVGMDTLMTWFSEKLVSEYGVRDINVKRVRDAVAIVVKADGGNLDKVEKELRNVISNMGFGEKIEIEVVKSGQRR